MEDKDYKKNPEHVLGVRDSFENVKRVIKDSRIQKVEELQKYKHIEVVSVMDRVVTEYIVLETIN